MSDIVEKCQCWLCANEKAAQAAEIERLRAALRDIEENSFSIYARDIARAALAAPSGALEERT